ncbi:hypothetical protein NM208_g1609 [Fusarium decemcellulare]|uniref:Uncharacterized protein n=1 Tax=Fusarium decemcellulare TaxID=57161 RepID=A0ACC1SVK8_9HYPO|nr:hypothetical protein NM208_g1609 [Fusarium decemcellulare]
MQITVAPASAQTSRAAVRALLDDSSAPTVIGIYRNLERVPAEFQNHPNFKAVKGDLTDGSSLDFAGSDAVITMTPPKYDGSDYIAIAKAIATNVRQAVDKLTTVKRLVYVSSMGAQYAEGVVRTNHHSERILEGSDADVVLVRNCYFMENWMSALETIKADPPHFYSTIAPLDYALPMVSARDIGRTCAREALGAGTPLAKSPRIFELHGPRNYSVRNVKEAFEKVTGKKIEARLVEKPDLHKFFSGFLPANIVDDFVEMTLTFLPGGLLEDEMNDLTNVKHGQDTLVDAFSQMWKTN